MDSLILKNVRCFANPGPIPLAPLTLLIGENSTGKSTFLAAVRLAAGLQSTIDTPDFNEEPFLWGAYDQIANYRGGRAGRAESFSIGFGIRLPAKLASHLCVSPADMVSMEGKFTKLHSQPSLCEWTAVSGSYRITLTVKSEGVVGLKLGTPSGSASLSGDQMQIRPIPLSLRYLIQGLLFPLSMNRNAEWSSNKLPWNEQKAALDLMAFLMTSAPHRPYATAPIRTEPKRTYDPTKDTPTPTGSHVPMILAKMNGGAEWKEMRESLENFGSASGLFDGLEVKRLGRQEGSPFQIFIKVVGPAFNLVDVGYGVSQILPVVVDMLQGKKGQQFLIQQPEVHLHPRAQAELGTMMALLAKSEQKQFVVETHSDYLIDRVRTDVRDKKGLRPEDVAILYFERGKRGDVQIHHMQIDAAGNLLNVPPGYRGFFLDEQRRFLGV